MELTKRPVDGFLGDLASDAPAPGGGSTAALESAMGAALTAMVCGLTLSKKSLAERHAAASEIRGEAERLGERLARLVDRDTEGFLTISAAYAMPKATEAEKAARSAAIQAGLAVCTEIPLEVMSLAAETLALADRLLEGFNENAASDLGVAALSLASGVRGAWLNVLINIGGMKDRRRAAAYWREGRAVLERAETLADRIYRTLLALVDPEDLESVT